MNLRTLPLTLLVLLPAFAQAQQFVFDSLCRQAYTALFSLRLDVGIGLCQAAHTRNPANLIPLMLENYADFFHIFICEDPSQLESFKNRKNKRLSQLKKSDSQSPWMRHAQAQIQLQYALALLITRQYVSGLLELRRAFFLFEENIKSFPNFKPSYTGYYLIQSLTGTAPVHYQWALKLMGFDGSGETAMHGFRQLYEADWGTESFLKDEALHVWISLLFHLKGNKQEAWSLIQQMNYPLPDNLFSYLTVIRIALHSNHNDQALSLLDNIPASEEYPDVPLLAYFRGLSLLHKLDPACISYFELFLSQNKSASMVKTAYQKIAWAYLIQDKPGQYHTYITLARERGEAITETDRQAQNEATANSIPHPQLLRARLLFDGGYYARALTLLNGMKSDSLNPYHQTELAYRLARTLHESGDTAQAIPYYMTALNKGRNLPYYFAANAALNLGYIYEARGNYPLAKMYFTQVYELDNHAYAASLQLKAKAALARIALKE